MPAITYTAKREIVRTGYSKSGTDISANGTNDTFNSVTTNLSGLANDKWVLTAGFTNAANNGWFQANGASTATQITQDTSTALVTEAAGNAITLVGYERGLGQAYSLDFIAQQLTRSAAINRQRRHSLSGQSETRLFHRRVFWDVTTDWLLEAEAKRWREILASIEAGEVVTFDPYGSIASPDAPVSCELDSDEHQEPRTGALYVQFAFRLRVL